MNNRFSINPELINQLKSKNLTYTINFSPKKSSSASIRDGVINLRISSLGTDREQERHINDLLARVCKKFEAKLPLDILKYSSMMAFGKFMFKLIKTETQTNQLKIHVDSLKQEIKISYNPTLHEANQIKNRLAKKICQALQDELELKIRELARQTVNIQPEKVEWRNLQARWGHCNFRTRSIALAEKMVWCPWACVEYVIIHELCHLVEPNHAESFWRLVDKFCPNYKKKQAELKHYQ